MIFSSEKKELWRYASRNNANCATGSGNSNRPQQLHRHQHQHRLQSPPPDYYLTTNDRLNNSLQLQQHHQQQQLQQQQQVQLLENKKDEEEEEENQQSNYNTPPPPYSSVPCGINYSINACPRRMSTSNNSNDGDEESNYSVDRFSMRSGKSNKIIDRKSSTCISLSNGSIASYSNQRSNNNNHNQHDYYNYNNNNSVSRSSENIMKDFVTYDQLGKTIMPSLQKTNRQQQQQQPIATIITQQPPLQTTTTTTTTTTLTSTAASVLAATAANIFRNCCGGGSNNSENYNNNNNNARSPVEQEEEGEVESTTISSSSINMCRQHNVLTPRQYFDALIKQLKEGQVTAMLKAVKSRMELVTTLQHQPQQQQKQQTNCCILVHRAPILNELPYVIACRLFFWYDLKDANELKRLPTCPNACDPIYICCNPLHWCRICKTGINYLLNRKLYERKQERMKEQKNNNMTT